MEYSEDTAPIMTFGDWALTIVLTFIPLVGFFMLLYWAMSSNTNPNKQNWARAMLVIYLIVLVMYLMFGAAFINTFMPVG